MYTVVCSVRPLIYIYFGSHNILNGHMLCSSFRAFFAGILILWHGVRDPAAIQLSVFLLAQVVQLNSLIQRKVQDKPFVRMQRKRWPKSLNFHIQESVTLGFKAF